MRFNTLVLFYYQFPGDDRVIYMQPNPTHKIVTVYTGMVIWNVHSLCMHVSSFMFLTWVALVYVHSGNTLQYNGFLLFTIRCKKNKWCLIAHTICLKWLAQTKVCSLDWVLYVGCSIFILDGEYFCLQSAFVWLRKWNESIIFVIDNHMVSMVQEMEVAP